jgi:hypothetical protein
MSRNDITFTFDSPIVLKPFFPPEPSPATADSRILEDARKNSSVVAEPDDREAILGEAAAPVDGPAALVQAPAEDEAPKAAKHPEDDDGSEKKSAEPAAPATSTPPPETPEKSSAVLMASAEDGPRKQHSGRGRKPKADCDSETNEAASGNVAAAEASVSRTARGRPRKNACEAVEVGAVKEPAKRGRKKAAENIGIDDSAPKLSTSSSLLLAGNGGLPKASQEKVATKSICSEKESAAKLEVSGGQAESEKSKVANGSQKSEAEEKKTDKRARAAGSAATVRRGAAAGNEAKGEGVDFMKHFGPKFPDKT